MTDPATIVLPILLPLLCGGLLLFFRTRARVQRAGLVISMALNLVGAVILFSRVNRREEPIALNMGGWEVPVGIGFYADLLAAIMILVTAIIAMAGALYALGDIGQTIWKKNYAFFFVLLITGINGAFLTQDLFNLFVWFEVMLIASFAMMILGRRRHTYEGALKYVALNMTSSFFFLSGLGILYGKVGSLNLDNIATVLATSNTDPLILTSAALLLMAFGIKAGVFPLF
ncbi:MAG: proton-conducting transporter membrane subunit, partial [Verrucomicrobiota bacterium]